MDPTPILIVFAVVLLILGIALYATYQASSSASAQVSTVIDNISTLNEAVTDAKRDITSLQMASAVNGLIVQPQIVVLASNFVNVQSGAVAASATWITLSAISQLVFIKAVVSQTTVNSVQTAFNLQLVGSSISSIDFLGCISGETNATHKDIYNIAQYPDATQANVIDISYTAPPNNEAHTLSFVALVTLIPPSS